MTNVDFILSALSKIGAGFNSQTLVTLKNIGSYNLRLPPLAGFRKLSAH